MRFPPIDPDSPLDVADTAVIIDTFTPRPELRLWGFPESVVYLLSGLPLALCFMAVKLLHYPAWLIGSIFHECGHTFFAWLVGCPAFPAFRLDGHAATMHRDQIFFLTFPIWGGLIALGVWLWRGSPLFFKITTVAVGGAYPFVAYHPVTREVAHLLSGHMGELLFASIFFWRTKTGWFVQNPADRVANSLAAWYLLVSNLWLCYGVIFDPLIRVQYHTSGSFGFTNDYIRIARDWMHCSVDAVAWSMLIVSLCVLPLTLWATKDIR